MAPDYVESFQLLFVKYFKLDLFTDISDFEKYTSHGTAQYQIFPGKIWNKNM